MYKLSLLPLLLLVIISYSCKKEEVSKILTQEDILGIWFEQQEEGVTYHAGHDYNFEFTEDSFYLERKVFSDMIFPKTKCPSNRIEFISGTYLISPGHYLNLTGRYDEIVDTDGVSTCLDQISDNFIWSTQYFYDGTFLLLNADLERPIRFKQQ